MPSDAILLAVIVGVCTWGFRYLPLRAGLHDIAPGGPLGRFLAAIGPAAVATLFVAAAMPYAHSIGGPVLPLLPLLAGVAAVLVVFAWRKSVVLATLAGSVAFGLVAALAGG